SNSTLSGNSAGFDGGGIFAYDAATVNNTIIAGNTAAAGSEECSGSITGSNNVFGVNGNAGGCPGPGNIVPTGALSTVVESTLAANGTTILAGDPNAIGGQQPVLTLALVANSPALEAADPAICAAPPINNLDQRGVTRPQPASTICDIGAFESALSPTPEPTPTPTPTPTPEPSPTPTSAPSPSPTPTPTPTSTPEPSPPSVPEEPPAPEEPPPTPTPPAPPSRPLAGRLVWDPARLIVQEPRQIPTLEISAAALRGVAFDFRNLGGAIPIPIQVCVLLPDGLAFSSAQLPLQESTQVVINGVTRTDFTTQLIPAGEPVPAACNGENRHGAVVVTLLNGLSARASGTLTFQVVVE
ncbi:MAG: choice-of-anchor Q domain-containing protein, partial [Thermostichus sp. BF3_bins_97]